MIRNLLVLGAESGSIGRGVEDLASKGGDWNVTTVGRTIEDHTIDMSNPEDQMVKSFIEDVIWERPWHAVVSTLGVNRESFVGSPSVIDPVKMMLHDYKVNTLAPLAWLNEWLIYWNENESIRAQNLHFAAISSNSAHVPRSTGASYCSSKSALSMALRCVARDVGRRDQRVSVYAYEPGWVDGTSMSREVRDRIPQNIPATRAPGDRKLSRADITHMIVANLNFGHAINGSIIRVDAGES